MAIPKTEKTDSLQTFRENANNNAQRVGDLVNLNTTDKSSIVNAVNEVNNNVSDAGVIAFAVAL